MVCSQDLVSLIDKSMSVASEDKWPGNVREEGTRHKCSCLKGAQEHEELERAPLATSLCALL